MIGESTPEEKEKFVEEECEFPGCKMRKYCVAAGCVCPAMVRVRNQARSKADLITNEKQEMRLSCFGRFDGNLEECTHCFVATECYEATQKAGLPGTETPPGKSIRRRVPEMAVYR